MGSASFEELRQLVTALAGQESSQVVPALLRVLELHPGSARAEDARALGKARVEAASVLAALGIDVVLDVLDDVHESGSVAVLAGIADALGETKSEHGVPALESLVVHDAMLVSSWAALSLSKLGHLGADALARAGQDETRFPQLAFIVEALGRMGGASWRRAHVIVNNSDAGFREELRQVLRSVPGGP